MKRYQTLSFLIALLFTFSANSQTSVYHPFPDSNAVWNFHYGMYCFANGTGDENYSITLSGDTLINSQVYHKLTIPFVQSFSIGNCGGTQTGYKGAIREDTSNKKIFFVQPYDSLEQLLYDFNLQTGDTVKGYIESNAFNPDTVNSIDSVLIGNNYRKRWNINTGYNISFIEGIGSTYGLIEKSPGGVLDMPDYSLICFLQNGITLYPDTTTLCELITGVNDFPAEQHSINILPNPFHDSAILELGSETDNSKLRIFSSLGNLIREENLSHQKSIIINRIDLTNGIYFLQLINSKDLMIVKKIVVN